jgi:hypothetical protein
MLLLRVWSEYEEQVSYWSFLMFKCNEHGLHTRKI